MSSMQQISTSISDLILAITSFGTAAFLLPSNVIASAGFTLMGLAASCGTYRFSLSSPSPTVLYWHQTMAWLATVVGMSLIASGFHRRYDNSVLSAVHMVSALALVCLSKGAVIFTSATEQLLVSMVSTGAVASVAIFSILHANPFGILAAVLYAAAGAVGITGHLGGILCVDWFHYLLAFANVVFLRAFAYSSPRVYYKDN